MITDAFRVFREIKIIVYYGEEAYLKNFLFNLCILPVESKSWIHFLRPSQ